MRTGAMGVHATVNTSGAIRLGERRDVEHPLPPGEGRRGARIAESESLQSSQRSGGVRGQGLPRFTSELLWWSSRSENPSPRLFRAECFGADSLHAGLRAPEPTLSRGERVVPVALCVSHLFLASAHPPVEVGR